MYGCSLHKWLELVAPLGGEQGRLLPRGHCRRAPSQNYLQEYSATTKDQFTLMRQKITPWAPLQYKGQCVPWYHQGLITKYRSLNFIRCEAFLGPLFKIGNSPIGHHTSTDIENDHPSHKWRGTVWTPTSWGSIFFWPICRRGSGLRILKLHLNYFINIALYYVSMISGFESNYQYRNNLCS